MQNFLCKTITIIIYSDFFKSMAHNFHIVTSFNFKGYEKYGKNFLETFKSKDVKVYVGTEDDLSLFPKYKNVKFFPIDKKMSERIFSQIVNTLPDEQKNSYQFQAHRFCFKVQALASNDHLPDDGYRVWIDADVVFKKEINAFDLNKICEDNNLTFLGRDVWWHTETGFIIFKLNEYGKTFLFRWLWYYTTGRFILLTEWNDSYIFDVIRKEFASKKIKNLSSGIEVRDVWPETILNEYMTHLKGTLKNESF